MNIGLALSGGGARGFAHIGVLRALAEHDLTPVAIAGCSMGGIVGALYAAGHGPDAIAEMFEESSYFDFLAFGTMGGLIGGRRIGKRLEREVPDTFEQLELPVAVTVVDVQEGQLMVLRSGPLPPALQATSALPGVLSPVKHLGRVLIDGGLLNNLPVDVIRTMTTEPVIAVDVAAPPNRHLDFEGGSSFWKQVESLFDSKQRALTIELFMKAFDVPQALVTEVRLAMHPPDLLIRPTLRPGLKVEDFDALDEAVAAGYQAARQALRTDWIGDDPAASLPD
jgi:NTE family protein